MNTTRFAALTVVAAIVVGTSSTFAAPCESIESAAHHLLSRKSDNGMIAGAGFYIECPPRNQWDGITQCYSVAAFRAVARLCRLAGRDKSAV